MRAIKKAGVQLCADLFVTGVAQETSAPFDANPPFETWSGVGPRISQIREGFGCRWLVEHGIVADYALVGEITDFTVSVAQAGYLRLRIAVPGSVGYTPALMRGPESTGSPNPFERAGHVIVAIEQWARSYEQECRHEFWGGTIIPKAQIYEIQSSGPAWTEANDHCLIFLESVRRLYVGLQSFRSMSRMDASLMKASALRLRFSQSLASRRQRLSQAMVRSTPQRLGWTTKPFTRSDRLTISVSRSGRMPARAR